MAEIYNLIFPPIQTANYRIVCLPPYEFSYLVCVVRNDEVIPADVTYDYMRGYINHIWHPSHSLTFAQVCRNLFNLIEDEELNEEIV